MKDEKIKDFLSKSAEFSKTTFSKATKAVQKFSDKSVLKIQIQNLKSTNEKKYTEMGEKLSILLTEKGASLRNLEALSESEANVQLLDQIENIQKEIVKTNKDISKLEKELKNVK